ncbi:MAG TPA: SMP-30/gluconolactonase/LRE family protein [Longimicrobiales bacterium]|nr:SMP-30/gluconolactonase/LRE family protein [Longimicrobiales bacterium]
MAETRGALALALALVACGGDEQGWTETGPAPENWLTVQDADATVMRIEGFSGPESVRYDPDQDVWFVGNFHGAGGERDANGFVSRVSAGSGAVQALRFARGTPEHPLHAARGMFLTGDTLWVTDIDGVHGFDRRDGRQHAFVDLSGFEPGFLNDIAQGPDGALYVTDTGRSAVYRVDGRQATEALVDESLGGPNGITWDPARSQFVLVPWQAPHRIHLWTVGSEPQGFGPSRTPGGLDGVEAIDRRILFASQSDSALHLLDAGGTRVVIHTSGAPADIGLDTRRRRVAVPYVALNRVDVWQLPPR